MRTLTKKDIKLNNVDTIKEFKILQYLKDKLDINSFEVTLIGNDTIKVSDKLDTLIFKLEDNKVIYEEKIEMKL